MRYLKQKNPYKHRSRQTLVSRNLHRPKDTHLPLKIAALTFLLFAVGLNIFGIKQGHSSNVLAYATNTTVDGLLSATNAERTNRGLTALALNSKLVSSSQAKSDDMVAINYWAHNRPDGTTPWVFFANAGYQGLKEGENLAYGQLTAQQAVNEWMASPSHRDNILDSSFCEVGFGITNSSNFVNTGPETIVAAHYGQPTSGCPSVQPVAAPQPTKSVKPATNTPKVTVVTPTPAPATTPVAATPESTTPPVSEATKQTPTAYTNLSSTSEPDETRLTRIQLFTHGQAPWTTYALTIVLFVSIGLYILKHAIGIRKTVLRGEKWVLHHPALDMTILGIIALSFYLTRYIGGVIK